MITRETQASVLGIDVNPTALAKAARGVYSYWSLRETPEEMKRRWFVADGKEHGVDPSLRAAVRFEEHNLVDDEPAFWRPHSYDVIFCRNVLMYLTPERASAVVARFARALVPGGYLFLGHAETLRGLSRDFNLRHTHATFYYQLKDAERIAADHVDEQRQPLAVAPVDLMATSSWIETVQRSAARIEELSDRSSHAFPGPVHKTREPADVSRALELLKSERFADALEALGEPTRGSHDPDVLLLRAVLLTLSGRTLEAERVCGELCQLDPLSAGAHYLLALCREGAGDASGAMEHNRTAAYLDPSFAMPRLHLGLLGPTQRRPAWSTTRDRASARPLGPRGSVAHLAVRRRIHAEALAHLCRAELTAIVGPR